MSAVPLRNSKVTASAVRTVTVLGATGSIGDSTMDLLRASPDRYRVEALTANTNVPALAKLAREFGARFAAVADAARLNELKDALAGTRTECGAGDEDAAQQIGTQVERIVKSLVFVSGEEPVVALCSGRARVDEKLLATAIGARSVRRATADEAKAFTGYAIGGVPPFAHARRCRVIADEGLLGFDEVWAAAGLPDAVFPIAPRDLVRVAAAEVARIGS